MSTCLYPPCRVWDKGLAYLEHLEVLQPLLHKLLHLSRILHVLVLPESVSCTALGVLSEVVRRELVSLAQKLTVLLVNTDMLARMFF